MTMYCPFTGRVLEEQQAPVRAPRRDNDPVMGDAPVLPKQVHVRDDGSRVEIWHGQRPTWMLHPMRESRQRKDGFRDRKPTEREAERNMAGRGHDDDARPLDGLPVTSVFARQDVDTLHTLAQVRDALPRG